jgi:hypothetical protein
MRKRLWYQDSEVSREQEPGLLPLSEVSLVVPLLLAYPASWVVLEYLSQPMQLAQQE